jgi:hypothetical protein
MLYISLIISKKALYERPLFALMFITCEAKEGRETALPEQPQKHALKEAEMNTQDMYTREKINKIHLDELEQEAQNSRMLRELKQERGLKNLVINHRRTIALAVSALIAAIASILLASNMGLIPTI